MKYLLILPILLSSCMATMPTYEGYNEEDQATIKFVLDTTAWTPFGKALSVELYNGCTNSRIPLQGRGENSLGQLLVKEADLGVKDYSIPAGDTLYIWSGISGGCGGPMELKPEKGVSYELFFHSRSSAQCSLDIFKIVDGKKQSAPEARSVRRKGLMGDESYSWRMCDYLEPLD